MEAALAEKQVDLLEPRKDGPQVTPAIYSSTVPAELIVTDGKPEFLPIEGTGILQVKNSDNALFVEVKSNDHYVLISGRWFKSRSLGGPWVFVPPKDLPEDFAKIPPDHPRGNVLVSVPGTPQAEQAVIANSIPQTAAVKRVEARLDVMYDGPPEWVAIEGTPLAYAVNTPLPVIRVDEKTYYCVENGVWFVATSPAGPWVVAARVPTVIYTIPPSSPLHYVAYVRVYGSTPEIVYVGYTPGYLGAFVSPDYVVVYGTGYWYRPYIGTYWVGYPCTYGFGAGFAFGFGGGFAFGFAAGAPIGVWYDPWWGPCGWGWHHGYRYTFVSMNSVNIYSHWYGRVTVASHAYARELVDGNSLVARREVQPLLFTREGQRRRPGFEHGAETRAAARDGRRHAPRGRRQTAGSKLGVGPGRTEAQRAVGVARQAAGALRGRHLRRAGWPDLPSERLRLGRANQERLARRLEGRVLPDSPPGTRAGADVTRRWPAELREIPLPGQLPRQRPRRPEEVRGEVPCS